MFVLYFLKPSRNQYNILKYSRKSRFSSESQMTFIAACQKQAYVWNLVVLYIFA